MKFRQYHMAHDCPQCGEKDAHEEWRGARMSSAVWGHSFCCCSDKCGLAFAVKHAALEKSRKGRRELAQLWEKFQDQSDARLTGEPYAGYDAEQTLRHLGRR